MRAADLRAAGSYVGVLRRGVGAHRRLIAAGCAALAVAAALEVVAPDVAPTVRVLASARDIAAGAALTADDVTALDLPVSAVPDGALRPGAAVLGRTVGGPVRRGETLTDARLVGPSMLAGLGAEGLVAVPVRLADSDAVRLVGAGDRVDVLAAALDATDGRTAAVSVVAADILVLATPGGTSSDGGALLLVAVSPASARDLARAATTSRLSIALRGPA